MNVVIVSGDKDFYQLIEPRIWLLNPGRGGPASVEEQWVGVENGNERLGVPPGRVTDYLAMVGDSSDNVPGVKGIGDKTARELVAQYDSLEAILAAAPGMAKKRPREALVEHAEHARLSKELVTIREDLAVTLDLDSMLIAEPDVQRLRELYIALEFHGLAKGLGRDVEVVLPSPPETFTGELQFDTPETAAAGSPVRARYETVDTPLALAALITRVREVGRFALDTRTIADVASPSLDDPLRSSLVGLSIAVAPGEAYYLPLAHRRFEAPVTAQADMLGELGSPAEPPAKARKKAETRHFDADSIAGKVVEAGAPAADNLPPLSDDSMADLRALLEDASVGKCAQNAKYDVLVLRRAGVTLRGVEFDTMLASYVLDPGRRSHGLEVLALEFLDHTLTTYDELCGKGRQGLGGEIARRVLDGALVVVELEIHGRLA